MAPHITVPVPAESVTHTVRAVTVTVVIVTGNVAEDSDKVIAAKNVTSAAAAIGAAAGKRAGRPETSENNENRENSSGVAQHGDLFEITPASASIQVRLAGSTVGI
jgi:hypothetical protein